MNVMARVGALVLVTHLVGTDVLRDAARLARDDVGLADGVEKASLTVVDVTHDGDDRWARLEVLVGLRGEFRLKVEAEVLEQFLVLVLRRHDLDAVAELGAERREGVLVERLRGGGHLTQVEQDGHERRGIDIDLLGKVAQRRTATQTNRRGAVSARDLHATNRWRLLLFVLCTLGALATCASARAFRPGVQRRLRCLRRDRGCQLRDGSWSGCSRSTGSAAWTDRDAAGAPVRRSKAAGTRRSCAAWTPERPDVPAPPGAPERLQRAPSGTRSRCTGRLERVIATRTRDADAVRPSGRQKGLLPPGRGRGRGMSLA